MSEWTHTKFNPEGVKGLTAQPPHKIFNFMAAIHQTLWTITFNVKDVNTGIELPQYTWQGPLGDKLGSERAVRKATKALKGLALAKWGWATCDKYRLTARQLKRLMDDGLITPPDLVEVTVANIESEPFVQPPKPKRLAVPKSEVVAFEPFDWD